MTRITSQDISPYLNLLLLVVPPFESEDATFFEPYEFVGVLDRPTSNCVCTLKSAAPLHRFQASRILIDGRRIDRTKAKKPVSIDQPT